MIGILSLVLTISMMITGGLTDFSVSLIGVMVCCVVALLQLRGGSIKLRRDVFWLPLCLLVVAVVTSFYSVDYTCNLLGVMRIVIVLLWGYCCSVLSDEIRSRTIGLLPIISVAGMVVSLIFSLSSGGRMSGPFLYANSWGMFLVLGIMICVSVLESAAGAKIGAKKSGEKRGRDEDGAAQGIEVQLPGKMDSFRLPIYGGLLILNLLGLFLTGSRSSMLLLIVWALYKAVQSRKIRKYLLTAFVAVVAVAGAAYFFLGNTQTFGRLFTLTKGSTSLTVVERALYYIDGLRCVASYPFGIGYMGYNYLQGSFQTGAYEAAFVHNDLLQLAIDYGIAAALLMVVFFGYQLIRGRQGLARKELLAVLLLGSLVDIHLQYLFMGMVLVLFLDLPEAEKCVSTLWVTESGTRTLGGKKGKTKVSERTGFGHHALTVYAVVSAVIFAYIAVPFAQCKYFGKYDAALALLPGYSECQEQRLEMMDDFETVNALSEKLLAKNKNNPKAWTARVVICELLGDTAGMCEAMDKSISLGRYDIELYRAYDESLAEHIAECESAIEAGNVQGSTAGSSLSPETGSSLSTEEALVLLCQQRQRLRERLDTTIAETNPLAYKLEMPEMTLE